MWLIFILVPFFRSVLFVFFTNQLTCQHEHFFIELIFHMKITCNLLRYTFNFIVFLSSFSLFFIFFPCRVHFRMRTIQWSTFFLIDSHFVAHARQIHNSQIYKRHPRIGRYTSNPIGAIPYVCMQYLSCFVCSFFSLLFNIISF